MTPQLDPPPMCLFLHFAFLIKAAEFLEHMLSENRPFKMWARDQGRLSHMRRRPPPAGAFLPRPDFLTELPQLS